MDRQWVITKAALFKFQEHMKEYIFLKYSEFCLVQLGKMVLNVIFFFSSVSLKYLKTMTSCQLLKNTVSW